jgi:hypothetical protein
VIFVVELTVLTLFHTFRLLVVIRSYSFVIFRVVDF